MIPQEAIEALRVEDEAEDSPPYILLLDQDQVIARLVACWPNAPRSYDVKPNEEIPEVLPWEHIVRWLWTRLEPDPIPGWIRAAGLVCRTDTIRKCWVAIDNKMVFPDYTRAPGAQKFIARRAKEAM